MALSVGDRLGPYEILALIGAGGMGEVYKARDTRLDRIVAIKVSKDQFTERFAREARSIASLNHPNICHLYDVGPNYLVMEYVEGQALTSLIRNGPLPLDEAMPVIQQLIDGIEAAHEKNIVHRDLKPANVKITPEGVVKILDFGLAKAAESPRGEASPENSPTVTMGATEAGTILGTASYMAPEQAKGKTADRRSDIWSFGVIVYELLTGKRPFDGETVIETLGAVLNKDQDWSIVPAKAQRLLRRCLERDRRRRLGAISDARWMLDEALLESGASSQPAADFQSGNRKSAAWMIVAAVAVASAGALAFVHFRETPPVAEPMHFSITLPEEAIPSFLALSPDGRFLVLRYLNQLWLRSLNAPDVRPVPGTEAARTPFWSPDSRTIAFFADGKLKTVPATGGPPQILCNDTGIGAGGTWSRDGLILFASEGARLYQVPSAGGACMQMAAPKTGSGHRLPVFLPNGKNFLYVRDYAATDESTRGLYVASLDEPNGRRILADQSSGVFVPSRPGSETGHLLFVRENNLMAQPFDARALQFTGDATALAQQISFTATSMQIAASGSDTGMVVLLANGRPDSQLRWLDRTGKELETVGSSAPAFVGVTLSRDGKQVAFGRGRLGEDNLWLRNLDRKTETRLTVPPLAPWAPVWSTDGQSVLFGSGHVIYAKDANAGGGVQALRTGDVRITPSDVSPDGRWLVYTETDPKTSGDIWLLPDPLNTTATNRKPVAFLKTPADESQGQVSPDGKWLAYSSDESGTVQVYLRPFPSGAGKLQVSTANGREPRWRADGKEIFYVESAQGFAQIKVMAVPVGAGATPAIGAPKRLYDLRNSTFILQSNNFTYSPSPDGQRFLVSEFATDAKPTLEVLLNWQAGLKR